MVVLGGGRFLMSEVPLHPSPGHALLNPWVVTIGATQPRHYKARGQLGQDEPAWGALHREDVSWNTSSKLSVTRHESLNPCILTIKATQARHAP